MDKNEMPQTEIQLSVELSVGLSERYSKEDL